MSTPKEEGARSFTRALEMLSEGRTVVKLSEELQSMVAALRDEAMARRTQATGELTLKLKVTVEEDGTATVVPESKLTLPKPRTEKTILWLTKGANLTPQNPRQQSLPLREVSEPATKVRGADDGETRIVRAE